MALENGFCWKRRSNKNNALTRLTNMSFNSSSPFASSVFGLFGGDFGLEQKCSEWICEIDIRIIAEYYNLRFATTVSSWRCQWNPCGRMVALTLCITQEAQIFFSHKGQARVHSSWSRLCWAGPIHESNSCNRYRRHPTRADAKVNPGF